MLNFYFFLYFAFIKTTLTQPCNGMTPDQDNEVGKKITNNYQYLPSLAHLIPEGLPEMVPVYTVRYCQRKYPGLVY